MRMSDCTEISPVLLLLQAELYSAPTGIKAAFVVKCTKGHRHKGGFHCTYGPGPAKPAYSQA
jgi:hypothetical protein